MKILLPAICAALLALPAAASADPPANNAREAPITLTPGAKVEGTTAESTLQEEESSEIDGTAVSGTVWYRFSVGRDRRVVLRLSAAGELDAAIEVLRRSRSQLISEDETTTDEDGRAVIDIDARSGATYLVRVGQRSNSVPGFFTLQLLVPELAPSPPGRRLPASGGVGVVDPLGATADAWSARLRAGVTYRIHIQNLSRRSLRLGLFAPGTSSFVDESPINRGVGYLLYTPPAGASGRYSLVVSATGSSGTQRYRLRLGRAQPDDMWPGRGLRNYEAVHATFASDSLDVVDTYRFDVANRSAVALRVTTSGSNSYDLKLLGEGGRRLGGTIGEGDSSIKRTLRPGRYVVAVRGRGRAAGAYILQRIARTLTRLRLIGPGTVSPGSAATLRLALNPGASGPAKVVIERLDPFSGWHYDRTLRTTISGGSGAVSFRPAIGHWRARASFRGTRTAEASRTRRTVGFVVRGPLSP